MSETQKMRPIWFFVAIVLTLYGILVAIQGIFYVFQPFQPYEGFTKAELYNPCLWWGAVMLVTGILFFLVAQISYKNQE